MTPHQLSDRVKQIVTEDVAADPIGWTASSLTDKIEGEWPEPLMPSRKLIYDRVRRAAHSLAKRGLVEVNRSRTTITFHPNKPS